MAPRAKWLLLSDIHFKHHDLDRINRTASWLTSLARQHSVSRAVVCGDLLTSRAVQSTHVLSACYRFIDALSEAVPRVNILLGNHDLAYKRDYTTSALNALDLRRLSPFLSLHSTVEQCVWDDRRVLLLPFREDQRELTDAVDALVRDHGQQAASETVALAHLAIHKAILQRHTISSIKALATKAVTDDDESHRPHNSTARPVTYHGLLGPHAFAPLARTFTGHFHSHQTILQQHLDDDASDPLRGSITYIGSPLQLTWADALDEQRGAILLDPQTLEHELVVNPFAVGYTVINVQDVIDNVMNIKQVQDMHVMLVGELSHFRHVMARDKLLAAGARSVRRWEPVRPRLQQAGAGLFGGLGATAPAVDLEARKNTTTPEPELELTIDAGDADPTEERAQALEASTNTPKDDVMDVELKVQKLDMVEEASKYVANLELDPSLENRRNMLVRVGQRLMHISNRDEDDEDLVHSLLLDENPAELPTGTTTQEDTAPVFVSRLRSLIISNFLGVQSTLTLDFTSNSWLRGLVFLVGANGSGKSTLIEAIVWCQFGKCIRSGLAAGDVVNDKAGRNCSVRLEFDNGYAITRYRKDKSYGNRVIVERDGEVQTQYEGADARSTQQAIDELLGIDYDGFIRTVVLGHESTTSFLKTTPSERRDLIEESLGLGVLDRCGTVARRALKEVDENILDLEYKHDAMEAALQDIQRRTKDLRRLKAKAESDAGRAKHVTGHLEEQLAAAKLQVQELLAARRAADVRRAFDHAVSTLNQQTRETEQRLQESQTKHTLMTSYLQAPQPPSPQTDAPKTLKERLLVALTSLRDRIEHWVARGTPESLPHERASGLRHTLRRWNHNVANLALGALDWTLDKLFDLRAKKAQEKAKEDELHRYNLVSKALEDDIVKYQDELADLRIASAKDSIIQGLSQRLNMEAQSIHDIVEAMTAADADTLPRRLEQAVQHQADLQQERASLIQEIHKESQAMTYAGLIRGEELAENKAKSDKGDIEARIATLSADRDVIAFWVSAFMKKAARRSSSRTNDPVMPTTFREYVLSKRLADLNNLTAQILTDLFEDVDQSNAVAGSMLHSLFSSTLSSSSTMVDEDDPDATVLDPSLSISSSLAYAKRSSGERKRMDLALFFALFQTAQAQSSHRARYALVDEVFDSLDEAGQRAVVRWCRGLVMGPGRGWLDVVVVITHSDFMVKAAGDGDGRQIVVSAETNGEKGTKLTVDGIDLGARAETILE